MRFFVLAAILLLCAVPNVAIGLTIFSPIPELVGVVDFPTTSGKNVSFSLGQEFVEIQTVSLEIEAEVNALEFDVCGTPQDPQPCVRNYLLVGFWSIMDEEGSQVPGTISTDEISFSDDRAVPSASGVDVAEFEFPPSTPTDWGILLDGEGSLTLFWNAPFVFGPPGALIQDVVEPSGEILNVRLVVEGTPVPEPSTALLIGYGLALLGARRVRA